MLIHQFNQWLAQQSPPQAAIDFFHLGGQETTLQLLNLLTNTDIQAYQVLDLGSGIGGTARLLAPRVAHVVGIDLQADYCQIAQQLNSHINNIEFIQANALQLPFTQASFDLVISEHLQMAIENKAHYAAEISRILRPGGKLLCFELFKTQHCIDEQITLPLPWADEADTQYLDFADQLQISFQQAQLTLLAQHDVSALCLHQLTQKLQRQQQRQHTTGSDILMGEFALKKQENLLKLLKNNWISCQQWLLTKS
jgi:ubiquinone/menaquinone biosynthesis C-methylase UbiE